MSAIVLWAFCAAALVVLAGLIGRRAKYVTEDREEIDGLWLGILIDDRQRFSLTHLQVVLWAIVFLSLLLAIFLTRLFWGAPGDALNITIPPEILGLAGISGGSAVIATAAKSTRTVAVRKIARTGKRYSRFSQVFMEEDGPSADKVVDVTKFQNFFLTLIAVVAYVAMASSKLAGPGVPDAFPGFKPGLLWLIGISHTTYIGGKLPPKT